MPGLLGTEVWLCVFLLGTCACFASISAHLCKVDTSLVRDTKFSILREWQTHKSYRIVWWSAETKQPGCRTLAPRIPGRTQNSYFSPQIQKKLAEERQTEEEAQVAEVVRFQEQEPGGRGVGKKAAAVAALLAGKPGALLQGTFPFPPHPPGKQCLALLDRFCHRISAAALRSRG